MTNASDATTAGSTDAEREIRGWFDQYDQFVATGNLSAMADLAAFPLNEVTDDAEGYGLAKPCTREKFLEQMEEVVGNGEDVVMESTREPHFLSPALCFVITDARFTTGRHTTQMRYGDLLIRTAEGWKFQTMVAGGWHDQM